MPWEKLLQRATCTCSFRWASFWDTSKILEIDTWLTGFITDFKQSNKLICCAKQSPQETFSRDATALWFLSWDEICVIISIIMNERSAHAQRKPPAARNRTFSPGKKKKQNYVNNKWCELLCRCWKPCKRETSGHRSPKHSLQLSKRYIWNNKMKIATRSTQQRYKRFYWQSTSLSPVVQMSHPCWNDRIIWVQKLDDVVWSDASWDVRNSPFVFRVRFTCIVRLGRFPYNSNIYYACSNFILFRTNSLK